MKRIAIALVVVAALPLLAKSKQKEKRFEAVAITDPRVAAGRYVGIDPDFVIELTAGRDALGGKVVNFGRTARLADAHIEGSELYATAVFADGAREPLHATFVNRIRNGQAAFGLLVRSMTIRIEDVTLTQLFCARR